MHASRRLQVRPRRHLNGGELKPLQHRLPVSSLAVAIALAVSLPATTSSPPRFHLCHVISV